MKKEIKYPKGKPMKVLVGSEFELQILLLNAKKEVFDDKGEHIETEIAHIIEEYGNKKIAYDLAYFIMKRLRENREMNKDIITARQCLEFKGYVCENRDCLNDDCPLNKKWGNSENNEPIKER